MVSVQKHRDMEKNVYRRIRRSVFLSVFNVFFSGIGHFWGIKRLVLKLACIPCGIKTRVLGPLKIGPAVELFIGEDVWVGQDFSIYGSGCCKIGDRCDIGPNVSILSGSHEIGCRKRRAGKGFHYTVNIGSGCWIGGKAVLYGNITIGDSSIIAAGAVVNRNVDKDTIVGGVPAKLIKQISD